MDRGTSTIRVVKHLQHPLSSEGLLEAPMDEAMDELGHATWGVIQGLSLPSLLQMLSMERKTCTIRVSSGRRMGFFYVREGQIINARYRGKEGMDAVQELIGAAAPKMEIDGQLHDLTQQIDLRLEEILMQTAQLQDEGGLAVPAGPILDRTEDSGAIPASEIGKWREPAVAKALAGTPSRSRGLLLAGLAMVVLLAAGVWLFLPRAVAIDVFSAPTGAAVQLNGKVLGFTPLHLDLPNPPQGTLSLRLPGHQPLEHRLQPGERSLNLVLQALPAPPPITMPEPVAASIPPPLKKAPSKTNVKPRPEPKALPKSDIFDQLRKQGD